MNSIQLIISEIAEKLTFSWNWFVGRKSTFIFLHMICLMFQGKKILITYLFFDHAKFLIYRFKMKSVKSGSIKKYFEISQGDFTNFLVDTRHERSDWTISKVQNFGGGWSCWSWKQKSIIKIRGVNLAIFMSCMRCEMRLYGPNHVQLSIVLLDRKYFSTK